MWLVYSNPHYVWQCAIKHKNKPSASMYDASVELVAFLHNAIQHCHALFHSQKFADYRYRAAWSECERNVVERIAEWPWKCDECDAHAKYATFSPDTGHLHTLKVCRNRLHTVRVTYRTNCTSGRKIMRRTHTIGHSETISSPNVVLIKCCGWTNLMCEHILVLSTLSFAQRYCSGNVSQMWSDVYVFIAALLAAGGTRPE